MAQGSPPSRQVRRRSTHWSVVWSDRGARILITISGMGTILAILLVGLYLIYEIIPLFLPASFSQKTSRTSPQTMDEPVCMRVDEDQLMGWSVSTKGILTVFRVDSGETLETRTLFEGLTPRAVSEPFERSTLEQGNKISFTELVFGFENGTLRTCRFQFNKRFPSAETLYGEALSLVGLGGSGVGFAPLLVACTPHPGRNVLDLSRGEILPLGTGLVVRTPENQLRVTELAVTVAKPAEIPGRKAVRLVDYAVRNTNPPMPFYCTLTEDGTLRMSRIRETTNFLTGEVKRVVSGTAIEAYRKPETRGQPDHLLLAGAGDQVYLIWKDGYFQRYDTRILNQAKKSEEGNLLRGLTAPRSQDEGGEITVLSQLVGRGTLLVADSRGTLRCWFLVNDEQTHKTRLVCAHTFKGKGQALTALIPSSRTRLVAAGYANGAVRLLYVTSENLLGEVITDQGYPVQVLAMAPKEDALLALTGGKIYRWQLDPKHPEVTLKALFRPVWYEGTEKPIHKWESSSGDDAFEPKLGMYPLVFGTLKATFYSLLFGVPLALLSAIYTSEFMHPRTRMMIKPTIEMMASLPSVVLGFLAGLIFAEMVEAVVASVLACFLTVPFVFVGAARLVQFLPQKVGILLGRYRFSLFLLTLPVGLYLATLVGPVLEWLFFAGDLKAWLADRSRSPLGGWMFLFVPLSILVVTVVVGNLVVPWLRRVTSGWDRSAVAWVDFARFALSCVLVFLLALTLSWLFTLGGTDARDWFLGNYDRNNSLVVGFIMGFAIIPIIYTIAEDALSSVPEHLRSGSLATGATPWQTATRIVIPTAMSGLFSAVMIGMGRAIGETMIVTMATGNTPVLDMNLFNGFRALSANLAVELPEAAKDTTHYRTLFFGALCLFTMTFFLNTVAEVIRLRFRQRAYQL
jgi:phosphate transport system permease protein